MTSRVEIKLGLGQLKEKNNSVHEVGEKFGVHVFVLVPLCLLAFLLLAHVLAVVHYHSEAFVLIRSCHSFILLLKLHLQFSFSLAREGLLPIFLHHAELLIRKLGPRIDLETWVLAESGRWRRISCSNSRICGRRVIHHFEVLFLLLLRLKFLRICNVEVKRWLHCIGFCCTVRQVLLVRASLLPENFLFAFVYSPEALHLSLKVLFFTHLGDALSEIIKLEFWREVEMPFLVCRQNALEVLQLVTSPTTNGHGLVNHKSLVECLQPLWFVHQVLLGKHAFASPLHFLLFRLVYLIEGICFIFSGWSNFNIQSLLTHFNFKILSTQWTSKLCPKSNSYTTTRGSSFRFAILVRATDLS